MKRYLKIEGKIQFCTYNSKSWSLDIEILYQDLVSMFMEFSLIEFDIIDSLKIQSTSSSITIIICCAKYADITIVKKNGPLYFVKFTQNDINLIKGHLLRFYQNSCAPVDHIDIDVVGKDELSSNGSLVVKTPNALPPISGEKARKLLGL